MKYLTLLLVMLATIAEAREPGRPCLQLDHVKTQKLHQKGETYVSLNFKTSCHLEIQPVHSQMFEMLDPNGIETTIDSLSHWPKSAPEISAFLTVRASKDAALGNQKLHGVVHYKNMASRSDSEETLSFDVPLKILRPEPQDTFAHNHPVWDKVLFPFEVVGILIVYIPFCLFMTITGQDGCPSC